MLNDIPMMVEFAAIMGARTGFFKQMEISDMVDNLDKMAKTKGPGTTKKVLTYVGEVIDSANSAIENSVRTIAFIEALRNGFTVQDAVMVARNVTVDFNKKGNWGTRLGALYVFFNAGLQGNIRVMKALANRGGKDGLKLMTAIVTASALNSLIQRMIAPRDEEDRSEYDNIGVWERDSNIIAYIPGTDKRIKLPIPCSI